MDMVSHKISVITVCYNAGDSLEKTILSVINQTYKNIEFIIIDGNSTDGTIDIIKRYSEHITFWQSEPDHGIYDAMNKGIEQSHGDWLCFMNAGDRFVSSDVIMDVLPYLKDDISIFHGNIIKVYEHHKEIGHQLNKDNIDLVDFFYGTIDHQAAFIKRGLFEKYGKYNTTYQLAADWLFFMEVIGKNKEKSHYVDMDIAYFQMGGSSSKYAEKYAKEQENALRKECGLYYDYMKELSEYRLSSLIGKLLKFRLWLRKTGFLKYCRRLILFKF